MKGQIYLHEYNYPEAIKLFDKAIEVDPSYEDSYINKIYCLYLQKNYKECIEFATKVQTIFPNSADIPWYIGKRLLNTSRRPIAWEYYSPDDESVKYIREKLENQKLPEAEKNNYLYYDKIANFEKDICNFIESIRQKDDMFTFVIHGDD